MEGKNFFSSACSYWMYLSSAGNPAVLFSSAISSSFSPSAEILEKVNWRIYRGGRANRKRGSKGSFLHVRASAFHMQTAGKEARLKKMLFALCGVSSRLASGTTPEHQHQLRRRDMSRGWIFVSSGGTLSSYV